MRIKTKLALFLSASAWIVGAFVWPGCITAPLPSTRQPVHLRKQADVTSVKPSQSSRGDVTGKLGQPDAYLPDVRVACYRINTVTRRDVFLLFFFIPTSIDRYTDRFDIAFFQYDDQDHVIQSGMATESNQLDIKVAAKKWLATLKPPPH